MYFGAFDCVKEGETWNPENFEKEKHNLVEAGFLGLGNSEDPQAVAKVAWTQIWFRCTLGSGAPGKDYEGVFVGQHIDGRPQGYVRFFGTYKKFKKDSTTEFDPFHMIYEGMVAQGETGTQPHGWGRKIVTEEKGTCCSVSWWRRGKLHGNT